MLLRKNVSPLRMDPMLCGVLLLAGVLSYPPSQIVIGAQDPSVYVAAAMALAHDRKSTVDSPAHRLLTEEEREHVLKMPADPNRMYQAYSGVYLQNNGSGTMSLYLPRGPSYLLAFGFLASDLETAFYANTVYFVLSACLFFLVARMVFNPWWAAAATTLLLFCPAQLWFGRATYSELPSQFFILLTLVHLQLAEDREQSALARAFGLLAAVGAAAGAMLMRVDQAVLLFLLLLALPWVSVRQRASVALAQVFGVLLTILVIAENRITGPIYYGGIQDIVFFVKPAVWFAVGAVVASAPLYIGAVRTRLRAWYGWVSEALFSERGWALYSAFVIALLVYGFVVRDTVFPKEMFDQAAGHNAGQRTMNEVIFARLAILCGAPVFVLSFWGVLRLFQDNRVRLPLFVLIAVAAAYGSELLFNQRNSPMLYWASRRYLPVIVPAVLLSGIYMIERMRIFDDRIARRFLSGILLMVSLAPMLIADRHLLWRGEMNGMLSLLPQLNSEFDRERTIYLSDLKYRHYNFTLRFLGNYQLLQIPELAAYQNDLPNRIPALVQRLRTQGYRVVLLGNRQTDPIFTAITGGAEGTATAAYSRLGENLDQFPNTRWYRNHQVDYLELR